MEYSLIAEEMNKSQEENFRKVPYNQRALLLPHCLNEDYKKELGSYASNLGYKVHVLKGGSAMIRIIQDEKPKAIVGIACFDEIDLAVKKLESIKMPYQAVMLCKNGCDNTLVDIISAKEKISLK